jgi:DNA-binding transcriptional ArsR family regulator
MSTQIFAVLSEPNRLEIVELLYKNPFTVNEIVDKLHLNQPQVSKHLKVLADAGIVGVYPVKNKRVYSLRPQPFQDLDKWLSKYRTMWEYRFERLDKLLEKEMKKGRAGEKKHGRRK